MDFQTNLILLLTGIIVGAFLFYWTTKFIRKMVLWWRFRKAKRAESKAEKLLKKHGYKILEKETVAPIRVKVDTELFETFVRADFTVEKDGMFYVAEVKTGERAPSILDTATRRQLLEYNFAFNPDGILLVDMERRKIHNIEFQGEGL